MFWKGECVLFHFQTTALHNADSFLPKKYETREKVGNFQQIASLSIWELEEEAQKKLGLIKIRNIVFGRYKITYYLPRVPNRSSIGTKSAWQHPNEWKTRYWIRLQRTPLSCGKWSSFEVSNLHGVRSFHNQSQSTPFGTVDLCSVIEQMSVEEHVIFIISQHLVTFLLHLPPNSKMLRLGIFNNFTVFWNSWKFFGTRQLRFCRTVISKWKSTLSRFQKK